MGIPTKTFFCTLALLVCMQSVRALNCITCENCEILEEPANSKSAACKANQNKCVKLILMNGEVDRLCGDSKRCVGREGGRKSRSPEEYTNLTPKHRTIRQLLQAPGAGGAADNSKELATMHCCDEDDCNGAPGSLKVALGALALVPLFRLL